MQNDEIDFRPFFKAVGKFKTLVLLWIVIGGVVALVITLVIPAKWKCQAVLLLPLQSNGASALAGLLSDKADPLEMMKGVLQSHTTETTLANLPLPRKRNLDVKDIDKSLAIQTQKDQNQVVISFTDRDKALATQVVNNAIECLRSVSAGGNMSLAVMQANSLKKDIDIRNALLEKEEDRLVKFTKHSKTPVDPTNPFASDLRAKEKEADYELAMINRQIKTALDTANQMGKQGLKLPTAIPNQETLRERLVSQEYQLDTATTTLGADNPQVKALRAQIEVTRDLIKSEVAKYLTAANQGIDPMLAQLFGQQKLLDFQKDYLSQMANVAPDEALKAARIFQEVSMEEDALKLARAQYEQSKLNGLVDPLQWSILSPPFFEDKPENKRFGLYSALGCLCGLLVGALAANIKEGRQKRRTAAAEAVGSDV